MDFSDVPDMKSANALPISTLQAYHCLPHLSSKKFHDSPEIPGDQRVYWLPYRTRRHQYQHNNWQDCKGSIPHPSAASCKIIQHPLSLNLK
ncbi:hypothetical protein DsansV1_C19g0156371 [Dioscorea sansibarensis]